LVKEKAHRGEPANKETNIQADKAISSKNVSMEWHVMFSSLLGMSLAGKKAQ